MNSNDNQTNSWLLTKEQTTLVGLAPGPSMDDQIVLQQLEGFFSCPDHAAKVHDTVRNIRGGLHHLDLFATGECPNQIQSFSYYQSVMRPAIEDFLSRARVTGEELLASCRSHRDRPKPEASLAVAYVLASEYFESFKRLMRNIEIPTRMEEDTSEWLTDSSERHVDLMDTSSSENTMDMSSTTNTDMGVASSSGAVGKFNDALGLLGHEARHPRRGVHTYRFREMEYHRMNHLYYFGGDKDKLNNSSTKQSPHSGKRCGDKSDGDGDKSNNDEEEEDCSEEEFSEPDPSDPGDGSLPCLARRPLRD